MLLQAASPPQRGSYVEVGRGRHLIVARVMWTRQHRVGVHTQDLLPIDSIIAEPGEAGVEIAPSVAPAERRAAPRPAEVRHAHSRLQARAVEFACIGAIGIAACMLAFGAVEGLFARPLHAVEAALNSG